LGLKLVTSSSSVDSLASVAAIVRRLPPMGMDRLLDGGRSRSRIAPTHSTSSSKPTIERSRAGYMPRAFGGASSTPPSGRSARTPP
jgi:hypothetical protein